MMAFTQNIEEYGAAGALVKMDGFSAGRNSTVVCFSCDDCAVEEARIAAAGGSVVKSKMVIGEYGCISLGTDSEGNMFGLHAMN